MDAFELLKQDHKKVSQLFSQIESSSGSAKKQLFSQLKSELDLHAHIEESFLYPALENKEVSREITLEAYEEHRVVKDLLAELANGSAPEDEWDAKLKVLKENVEHHVEEEEGELFGKAEDALSDEQIEKLGADMEREKISNNGGNPKAESSASNSKKQSENPKKSPGVLKRLADFVLGEGSSKGGAKKKPTTKASRAKSTKKAAPSKSASSKGKSSKSSTKTSRKSSRATKATKASKASKKKSTGARSSKTTAKRTVSSKTLKKLGSKTGRRR